MSRLLQVATVLLLGVTTPLGAQQSPPPVDPETEPRQVVIRDPIAAEASLNASGFADDYQVGPGDQIEVQVIGREELRASVRVSNLGEVNLPMLGPVPVANLTTFEIEDEIALRLRDGNLVLKPEVLVAVRDYMAKPIYVMGAVSQPGEFIMSQALTVVDAILMAGGLRFNAADRAFLYRRPAGSTLTPAVLATTAGEARPGVELVELDLAPFKEGRLDDISTTPLRRGDVIVVPSQVLEQFFVVGDVIDPRNFLYVPGKPLLASQALSWAGGPLRTAKLSEGILVRYDASGNRTEIKMDWGAIIRGTQPDFPIQPNDIIFVPGSAFKTITYGLLDLTGTMMQSAAFRVGRTYQLPDAPDLPQRPVSPQQ